MAKDGGWAYPTKIIKENHRAEKRIVRHPGMSLRDWFAGQALGGFLAGRDTASIPPRPEYYAIASYAAADAMLAERNK